MNSLLDLNFTTIRDFSITIGKIEAGWMEITLSNPNRTFTYEASYLTDPLNGLLDVMLAIMENPLSYTQNNVLSENTRILVHDLETDFVVWLFNYTNETLRVAIWLNIDFDLLDDFRYFEFNEQTYREHTFEDPPNLTENLLFALEGSHVSFLKTLKQVFENLDKTYVGKEFEGKWGYSYNKKQFHKLMNFLYD